MAIVKEEVIQKYRLHENDRGSTPVQIAISRLESTICETISTLIRRITTAAAACSKWSGVGVAFSST